MAEFSEAEKIAALDTMIREKHVWLNDFSSGRDRRPEHELQRKRYDIQILLAVKADVLRIASEAKNAIVS